MSEQEPEARADGAASDAGDAGHEWSASGNGASGAFDESGEDVVERPELLVGAAFLGGLALALLLRRRGD